MHPNTDSLCCFDTTICMFQKPPAQGKEFWKLLSNSISPLVRFASLLHRKYTTYCQDQMHMSPERISDTHHKHQQHCISRSGIICIFHCCCIDQEHNYILFCSRCRIHRPRRQTSRGNQRFFDFLHRIDSNSLIQTERTKHQYQLVVFHFQLNCGRID